MQHVSLDRDEHSILRDVSWRIAPGQRWVLLGPNGAGKTQLLKIVAGAVWPNPDTAHRLRWRGGGRWQRSPQGLQDKIAYLGPERQDKHERHGWNHRVREVVGTGVQRSDIPLQPLTRTQTLRVQQNLRRLRLLGLASRPFLTLSYGERRRVLFARALACEPGLLLLDELFTGLDSVQHRAVMSALQAPDRTARPWVLSVHRLQDVPRNATHLLALTEGQVQFCGPMQWPILRRLLASDAPVAPVAPVVPVAARPLAKKAARSLSRRLLQPAKFVSVPARVGQSLFKFSGANIYLNYRPVLREIDWQVRAGECWIVRGANGAGKSTLLRTIYGDHTVAAGGVLQRAGITPGVPLSEFKRRCGLVAPQLQTDYPRKSTVLDVVVSGLHSSIGLNEPASARELALARRALTCCSAQNFMGRQLAQLSYGQVRRVLFARALVRRPRLLLLDEAFTGLDRTTRHHLLALVDELIGSGVAVVLATHLEEELPARASRELRLCAGRAEIACLLPRG